MGPVVLLNNEILYCRPLEVRYNLLTGFDVFVGVYKINIFELCKFLPDSVRC